MWVGPAVGVCERAPRGMGHDEDAQDLEEIVVATLLADDPDDADSRKGCGGCLATALFLIAALALLGLAADWLSALLSAR
jgi:hypothetical protein